jgi:hypothetical protein
VVVAGGESGIFASRDNKADAPFGGAFKPTSQSRLVDGVVSVPETWLLVSGDHVVTVVTDEDDR